MANPSNAYIIANVLQDARDLRDRGALGHAAYDRLTAPLQPHAALAAPFLDAPGGHPAPLGADAATGSGSPPQPQSQYRPGSGSMSAPSFPGSALAPSVPPSSAAEDRGRPSVAALTARLGGLNVSTPRTPPSNPGPGPGPGPGSGSGSGSEPVPGSRPLPGGARAPGGVPKRAPPPAPAKVKAQETGGERAKALWDYKPSDADELEFAQGDLIAVAEHTTADWWKGHLVGAAGSKAQDRLFPANYVELIKAPRTAANMNSNTRANAARHASPQHTEKEKDAPPSYGAATYSLPPATTYGAAPPAAAYSVPAHAPSADYGSYGAPPPGSYGAYNPAPSQSGYPTATAASPAPFVAPSAAGLQPEPEDKRNARKEKMSKALDSNVGRAAVGGLAFGAAAGIVGDIL